MELPSEAPAMPSAAGSRATSTRAEGLQAALEIVGDARRALAVRVHALEPGLFDQATLLDALRALAVRNPGRAEIRILVHDAGGLPQSPLLPLLQRLTSSFFVREVEDPADRAYASAYLANDNGGWWFRPLSTSFDGQTALAQPGIAKQLREDFLPAWERARPCSELRALGI